MVCDGTFHEYLYGNTFHVKSDNNPLTYILTTARLDATGHHWVAQVVLYNFGVKYKAGKTNIEDDGLSCKDWNHEISMEGVQGYPQCGYGEV